jgi:hypothetical protein
MRNAEQQKVQIIDAFFVCPITKHVQANPLNRMKHQQCDEKQQHRDQRQRIGNNFLHRTKTKGKNKKIKDLAEAL